MKSTAKRNYPYLGIGKEVSFHKPNPTIVLFYKERSGTVVANACHRHKLGEHCNEWCEDNFIPYNGVVTIES